MSKILNFRQILLVFVIFFGAYPNEGYGHNKVNTPTSTITCDAPPPTNFRVTKKSTTYIDLAWQPIEPGAIQTLEIWKKVTANNWVLLFSSNSIPGDSYRASGLETRTEYNFKISTNCPNGDPGTTVSQLIDITTILELTLNGKTPVNPQPIGCAFINDLAYKWVGFRVSGMYGGQPYSNLFQFTDGPLFSEEYGEWKIRRVNPAPEDRVVAADITGAYPTPFMPEIPSVNPFLAYDISNTDHDIGRILLERVSGVPHSINICITNDYNPVWDSQHYYFETLVSNKVEEGLGQQEVEDRLPSQFWTNIKILNPVNDFLYINLPSNDSWVLTTSLALYNSTGQTMFDLKIEAPSEEIIIPIESLTPGFYILELEIKGESYFFKILKN